MGLLPGVVVDLGEERDLVVLRKHAARDGRPRITAFSCSSGRAVGSADPAPEVSTTPLMLNGAFWKSGTSRSYCTAPTLPAAESWAATRT